MSEEKAKPVSSYSKIEGNFQKATIVESHDGSSQALSSNRHPTAGTPVSAGHKRITDTLPTANPRLRAPLPPAAVALARRQPARDLRARGSTRPATPSGPLRHETQSNEQRQNEREDKNQAQAFLVRADFIAATRPPVARQPQACAPLHPSSLPCARVARKVRQLPRRKAQRRRPTPVSDWGTGAALLSLLHRGRRGRAP